MRENERAAETITKRRKDDRMEVQREWIDGGWAER